MPGYNEGDTVEDTFDKVIDVVGKEHIRELESIDSPIADNEVKVALRCGPNDYHFIREINGQWYNKSGTTPGIYVSKEYVMGVIWYGMYKDKLTGTREVVTTKYYNGRIIYFALEVDWDE